MRKLIYAAIFLVLLWGAVGLLIIYINYNPALSIKTDLLAPPTSYFSTERKIRTAILTQRDTGLPSLNEKNLQHAVVSLFTKLAADQKYRQIILISDPTPIPKTNSPNKEFPESPLNSQPSLDTSSIFEAAAKKVYPDIKLFILDPSLKESELLDKIKANYHAETLIIYHAYLNFSDQDEVLAQIQKQHYKNVFDNLTKKSFNTLINTDSAKAVYQFNKDYQSLRSLPTLEDSLHQYQIRFLTDGGNFPTERVTLTFFGDLMLGRHVRTLMDRSTLDYPFEKMDNAYLQMNDLLIANLEGPIAKQAVNTTKSIAFRFLPDLAPLLSKYHFDLLSLANNHAYDMGQAGFQDSYELLHANSIIPFGDARAVNDLSAGLIEVNGVKLALLGLNHTDFKLKKTDLIAKIEQLKTDGYQVIPFIHWGIEYKHEPSTEQVELAHAMVDAGAITVVGMHPHVVQSVEVYNNSPIFYSLGNAIFDQYFSQDTQEGLSVVLQISKEKLIFNLFPISIKNSQFALMNTEERKLFLEKLVGWWRYDQETKDQILKGEIVINLSDN